MNNVLEQATTSTSSSLSSRDTNQWPNRHFSKSEYRSQISTARVRLHPLRQTQQQHGQTQQLHSGRYKRLPSHRHRLLYASIWATVAVSLLAGIILLLSDIFTSSLFHALVSAAPLLLIGSTYLGFLALMRPKPLDLFKALIVSVAFLLWGIDQLLPAGWFATTLGDVVIVLYVIDLGWMIADQLKEHWQNRHAQR